MNRPLESEYAPYYRGYVAQVAEEEILPVLRSQIDALDLLLDQVTPERETYRYAEAKWSIREVVGHLIDGERVFGYRALCIARGENQNLPGFDEKEYMLSAPYNRVDLEDLMSDCKRCTSFSARFSLHYGGPYTPSHGSFVRTVPFRRVKLNLCF